MDFGKLFSKIFGISKYHFEEVHIDQEVIDSIIYYAKNADPFEFFALFDASIKNKILHIDNLFFLPGETSEEGAIIKTGMLPVMTSNWGSVHSHPGPTALPSGTDLATFAKTGLFHMIICRPYDENCILTYNRYGEFAKYKIV
ncbi:MAG: Mov34/MPN/PAD-1 family protein [Methanobacteriaceae archaeon]|nr:Mov34/MPN/PAD-1 family protein [Candidatus Methanorudis spinitermitis]